MEPPAKRLRILQSVELDETNPDYVSAKQKQQQKFKGRLESIFAKYESMHESMSDEIDMRENKVVVDRGHLRRLVRQVNRKETVLLDNLGLEAGRDVLEEESEDDEEKEESEDELAPTQVPKTNSGRRGKERQEGSGERKSADLSPSNLNVPELQRSNLPIASMVQTSLPHVPNTPNPAANLLQFVQFPHTPAGQQAQSSFYATLAQTINQAVQQAVAPLFSSILPNTPTIQPPFVNQFTLPTASVVDNDEITPATDPKWFFPPLSADTQKVEVAQPSPIPAPALIAIQGKQATKEMLRVPEVVTETSDNLPEATFSATAIIQSEQEADTSPSAKRTRRTSPQVEIQRMRKGPSPKYQFTKVEETFIYKQKVVQKRTWSKIKDSQDKWRNWPIWAFQNYWRSHIKAKDLHLKDDLAVQTTQRSSHAPEDESAAPLSHHLPTPSSLGHDYSPGQDESANFRPLEDITSSSTHFDNDELELLSLAGADVEEAQFPATNVEADAYFPDTNEIILPSVELNGFVDEDTLQQGLLEDLPMKEITKVIDWETIVREVKNGSAHSSPTSKRKYQPVHLRYQAIPDLGTEGTFEHDTRSPNSLLNGSFACDICGATFKNTKNLQRHQDNLRSTHDKLRSKSASINLVGDDELQAAISVTPPIKRELSTPPPTSFLYSTLAHQSRSRRDLLSSGVKSTAKPDRKAYLKQVKQSWTTKKATPTPKTVHKRRSLQTVPRKRAWSGDSDDELGM